MGSFFSLDFFFKCEYFVSCMYVPRACLVAIKVRRGAGSHGSIGTDDCQPPCR